MQVAQIKYEVFMERELILALKALKQKTGIAVDTYSSTFNFLYTADEKIPFEYSGGYTDGLQDKKQNVTLFRFRFHTIISIKK